MHNNSQQLPLADPQREEDAKELFPYKLMTAEEYAAREGHNWACFSFGESRYSDPVLDEWIHTLDDTFFTPGKLEAAQERVLSATELRLIRERMEEPF